MTLEEAITHCHEKAAELKERAEQIKHFSETEDELINCRECAAEHAQLAAWLTDYKRIKEGVIMSGRRSGKTAALIDFYLRPQGEWITDNGDKVCPFCLTGTTSKDNASLPLFKFCPYCGALMKGGAE